MKKIVIDAREINSSTGRYIYKLLDNLQHLESPYLFEVLVHEKDLTYWQPKNDHFKLIAVPFKKFTLGEQFGYWRFLKNRGADLVHFTMTQQPILYASSKVTTVHDLTALRFNNTGSVAFWVRQQFYRVVVRSAAKRSRLVITGADFIRSDIATYCNIDKKKIVVTKEAGDRITAKPEQVATLMNKKFIMYVGRPQPHKNLERLIRSFKKLHEIHPELVLALAGKKDGFYDQHEKLSDELGIHDSVVFTDFVSDGQLRWMYEHCAAYIFPSLSEGFGLPGLEAMMHGAPVVSSNATCLPEVYGDAAHYFDPYSINDMTTKISEVLTDTSLRALLIKKGAAQSSKYSWKTTAQETLQAYKQVLEDS